MSCRPLFVSFSALWLLTVCLWSNCLSTHAEETAQGVVFHDQNGNGTRDAGEPGLPGVRVSNGEAIVTTDATGHYRVPVGDDTCVFVLKPRDWATPRDALNLSRFYYLHKPKGSPDDGWKFPGVEPTGPLPASIDFALVKSPDPEEFTVIVMGDPQPASRKEVRFYANDVLVELLNSPALFGISMGDMVFDDLSLFDAVNEVQALVRKPWYNVLGNHDENYESPDDQHSDETFERVYGPTNNAFQYGQVHFMILDNVEWQGPERTDEAGNRVGGYRGRLNDRQLRFVENYVAEVPVDERIVICTHIPLPESSPQSPGRIRATPSLSRLLKILSKHPHTMSFSAHTHFTFSAFFGEAAGYTPGENAEHPHHNVATGSGSWYRGPRDVQGLPETTMADGAPNGYLLATFTGNQYRLRFKGARMPEDYQMAIHTPAKIRSADSAAAKVVVNVFNGNEKSTVRMRVRGIGDWQTLAQTPGVDPAYRRFQQHDQATAGKDHTPLPEGKLTPHLWSGPLGHELARGFYVLEVQATDMFGQQDHGAHVFEVR